MKILMLSLERRTLESASSDAARMTSYGEIVDELHVLVLGQGRDSEERRLSSNVSVYPILFRTHLEVVVRAFRVVRRLVREGRLVPSDTVLTVQDPFETGLFALFLKTYFGFRLHVQVHIDFFSPYYRRESMRQRVQSMLAPFVLYRAGRIRVVSSREVDYLTKAMRISADIVDNLPMRTVPGRYRGEFKRRFPQFEFSILMLSRLVRQKNYPLAMRAFRRVLDRHAGTGLVIIGEGPEERAIRELGRLLGLGENLVLHSWTNDAGAYYRGVDAFLLTSNYEGWGRTVEEAVYAGVPVIMTDVGCAGEYFKDGVGGLVVPVDDEDTLVAALLRMIEDVEFRNGARRDVERMGAVPPPSDEEHREATRLSWERTLA